LFLRKIFWLIRSQLYCTCVYCYSIPISPSGLMWLLLLWVIGNCTFSLCLAMVPLYWLCNLYIYSFEFPSEYTHFLQNNVTHFLLFILSLLLVYCMYNRLRNSSMILNSGVMLLIVFILLHAVFWHYDCVLYFWVRFNVALLVLLLKCFVDYYL
jgi:hypothetical protein